MKEPYDVVFQDERLHSVIVDASCTSVLQLWILRLKRQNSISNHFLYGRVLSSAFGNDKWSALNLDKFNSINDDLSIQVLPLNLYASSNKVGILIIELLKGKSLSNASQVVGIEMDQRIIKRMGEFSFGENFIVRPVMHLPTRDYFGPFASRVGPSSNSSFDSAAFSINKSALFDFYKEDEKGIVKSACELLGKETGMDFSKIDAWRLSDIEVLNSPGVNSSGKEKFQILIKDDVSTLTLYEPLHNKSGSYILFLKSYSDNCLLKVHTVLIADAPTYPYQLSFSTPEFKDIASAFTLEVYFKKSDDYETFLCLQIGNSFFREININSNISGNFTLNNFNDWIKKGVSESDKDRLKELSTISRMDHRSNIKVGLTASDFWVKINHEIERKILNYIPKKSHGKFFPRLSASRGRSRLDLIGWLRHIFEQYPDSQLIWIDPFMEDVGIDLLNRLGSSTGDYVVVTGDMPNVGYASFKTKMSIKQSSLLQVAHPLSLRESRMVKPKLSSRYQRVDSTLWRKESRVKRDEEARKPYRLQNMIAQCRNWSDSFGSVRLQIISLPHEKLHDRMIIIRSADGNSIAGFHLSNSIQRANDRHPLLVTPIPADILPNVCSYIEEIIRGSVSEHQGDLSANVLFDSKFSEPISLDNSLHSLSPWSMTRAGEIFSWWLDAPEMKLLSSDSLIATLEAKKLLVDGKLDNEYFSDLPKKFWSEGLALDNFSSAWDALGQLLAFSPAGNIYENNQQALEYTLVTKLVQYLNSNRSNALPPPYRRSNIDIHHYLSLNLDSLLLMNENLEHIADYGPSDVAYGDYYAIKLLWLRAAPNLIAWIESEFNMLDKGNIRQGALLICALRKISFSLCFNENEEHIRILLMSKIPFLNWIGLAGLIKVLCNDNFDLDILKRQDHLLEKFFPSSFCFFIREARHVKSQNLNFLVAEFNAQLPSRINDEYLGHLLSFLRNPLGRLYDLEPWILEIFLLPMLRSKKILLDQVAIQWFNEILIIWDDSLNRSRRASFANTSEGAFSDELVMLYENANPEMQELIISRLQRKFNDYVRIIRKPLSSQINYSLYSSAYHIILWMLSLGYRFSFARVNTPSSDLSVLIKECEKVIGNLSDATIDRYSNEDIFKYLRSDPEKIINHPLRDSIRSFSCV